VVIQTKTGQTESQTDRINLRGRQTEEGRRNHSIRLNKAKKRKGVETIWLRYRGEMERDRKEVIQPRRCETNGGNCDELFHQEEKSGFTRGKKKRKEVNERAAGCREDVKERTRKKGSSRKGVPQPGEDKGKFWGRV